MTLNSCQQKRGHYIVGVHFLTVFAILKTSLNFIYLTTLMRLVITPYTSYSLWDRCSCSCCLQDKTLEY